MKIVSVLLGATALAASLTCAVAQEIKIGATLSLTGPAASIGIPIKNAFQILPKEIDGVPVTWTILDDATDTTAARRNAEKLAADKIDLIIGGNTTPTSLATVQVAGASGTPTLAIAPSPSIIDPMDAARNWVFKIPLGERELANATMAKKGVKSFAFIGFNDAYGEGWLKEFEALESKYKIKMTAVERYGRTDSSVVAQVLKAIASQPDAVFVGGTGTPGALPITTLRERGFKGPIYGTSGMLNNDFLRVGAKAVEGVLIAGGPLPVAAALPDSNPSKAPSLQFGQMWDAAYKGQPVSLFAGNAYDAWLLAQPAVKSALKKAKPGTPEFRAAVRDALEATSGLALTNGVVNNGKANHGFYSPDSPVFIVVKDGSWSILP